MACEEDPGATEMLDMLLLAGAAVGSDNLKHKTYLKMTRACIEARSSQKFETLVGMFETRDMSALAAAVSDTLRPRFQRPFPPERETVLDLLGLRHHQSARANQFPNYPTVCVSCGARDVAFYKYGADRFHNSCTTCRREADKKRKRRSRSPTPTLPQLPSLSRRSQRPRRPPSRLGASVSPPPQPPRPPTPQTNTTDLVEPFIAAAQNGRSHWRRKIRKKGWYRLTNIFHVYGRRQDLVDRLKTALLDGADVTESHLRAACCKRDVAVLEVLWLAMKPRMPCPTSPLCCDMLRVAAALGYDAVTEWLVDRGVPIMTCPPLPELINSEENV